MTVTYSPDVSTAQFLVLLRVLFRRWKGSVFKLILKELAAYFTLYVIVALLYHLLLDVERKAIYRGAVFYLNSYVSYFPLSFILGFYVALVISRWWKLVCNVPWASRLACFLGSYIVDHPALQSNPILTEEQIRQLPPFDKCRDYARRVRRTIIRHVVLGFVLTMQAVTVPIKKRFPTLNHVKEAGLFTNDELRMYELSANENYPKHHLPFIWAIHVVNRAANDGYVLCEWARVTIINAIDDFRKGCVYVFFSDFTPIPMVYTQAVSIAVYSYFFITLFTRQTTVTDRVSESPSALTTTPPPFINPTQSLLYESLTYSNGSSIGDLVSNTLDMAATAIERRRIPPRDEASYALLALDLSITPLVTLIELVIYLGWLKVAETMLNPFGEDDDDFEVNMVLDSGIETGLHLVELTDMDIPPLQRDAFMEELQRPAVSPGSNSSEKTASAPAEARGENAVLLEPESPSGGSQPPPSETMLETPFMLPHTVASRQRAMRARQHEFAGSAANVKVKESERAVVEPEPAPESEAQHDRTQTRPDEAEQLQQQRRFTHSKSVPVAPEVAALELQPGASSTLALTNLPHQRTVSETTVDPALDVPSDPALLCRPDRSSDESSQPPTRKFGVSGILPKTVQPTSDISRPDSSLSGQHSGGVQSDLPL